MAKTKRHPFRTLRELFPLTWLGLFVLVGSVVATTVYGFGKIDLILLASGIIGIGLLIVTFLTTLVAALVVRSATKDRGGAEAIELECGYPTDTGFSLRSLWWLPLTRLAWRWTAPDATVSVKRRRLRLQEEVTPLRRCMRDEIERTFEVGDVFGLTNVVLRRRERRAVRAMPSKGSLEDVRVVRSLAGGDEISHPDGTPTGERIDIRRYTPGDPIRFILWKVFAKSRELVVRTPEKAVSAARQTVAYLVNGDGDEPAAGAARVAITSGALGSDFVFGADTAGGTATTHAEALDALVRSPEDADRREGDLGSFLERATPGGGSRALVFVPGTPGPWIDRVIRAASQARGNSGMAPLEVVICTDGIIKGTREGWFSKVVFAPENLTDNPYPPSTNSEVNEVIKRLGNIGGSIVLLDRKQGQVYGEEHLRRLGV